MKRVYVVAVIAIAAIIVLGLGLTFHSDCHKNCDKQPAYWYTIRVPYTNYSAFYNTSRTGVPQPVIEEEPHTGPSMPHGAPVEDHPVVEPHIPISAHGE